ncbi:MAG: argininosuccinate lyase [Herpetosiphon sp.]
MSASRAPLGVGDRLTEGAAPELVDSAFACEMEYGPLLYHGMSLADLASAIVLIEAGVVPAPIGARLLTALLELHAIPSGVFPFDAASGDPYTSRAQALEAAAGESAGWLSAGRARRESSTVGYAIAVRSGLLSVVDALVTLTNALLDVADVHRATLMPDYTYLQAAQPTSLAHYLLGFVQPMTRDLGRLQTAYSHTNGSPAGIGSTNGSQLPLERERWVELLGFQGLVLHTRDAMWQPDGPIEVMSTLTMLLLNIDRLAEDLQLWATSEFNYIELADRHSRISVIMPQKKNPYGLSYLRGVARDMIGQLTSTVALQATPSGQVDNRIFTYTTVSRTLDRTVRALRLMTGIVTGLTIHTAVMRQRAEQDYIGATDLAEAIMLARQLSPRIAHRIVGHAIRLARTDGSSLTSELLDQAAQAIIQQTLNIGDPFITTHMDPHHIVAGRTSRGGAAPQQVASMSTEFRSIATTYSAWSIEEQRQLSAAETTLREHAQRLCQPT